jgi:hypothetical protein
MEDQQLGQKDAALKPLKTPERSAPNIRRKRLQASSLTRKDGSPGHSTQMRRIFHESHDKLQAQHCLPFGSSSAQLTASPVQPQSLIRTTQPPEDVETAMCGLVDADSMPAQAYSLSVARGLSSEKRASSTDVGVSSGASVIVRTSLSHEKKPPCETGDPLVDKCFSKDMAKSDNSSNSQEAAKDGLSQSDITASRNLRLLEIDAWLDTVAKEATKKECRDTAVVELDETQRLSDLDVFLGRLQSHLPTSSHSGYPDDSGKESISPESGSLKEPFLRDAREPISSSQSPSFSSRSSKLSDAFCNAYPRVPQPSPATPGKRPWHSVAGSGSQQSVPPGQSQFWSSPGRVNLGSLGCASSESYCGTVALVQDVDPGHERKICPQIFTDECIDNQESGISGLSPHVTPYRKGKEPKRLRRPSYYDSDILFRKDSQQEGGLSA